MTTAAQLKQNATAQPAEPPSIKATYAGTYYKKVGKGYDYVPYAKTVRWPLSAVLNEGYTPIGLFHRYKKKKLMEAVGGIDTRIVELVKVEGELPRIKNDAHRLNWIADHAELVAFAAEIGEVRYVHVDLKTDERTTMTVELNPHLYPDVASLRHAIKMLITEPEAFDREQGKLAQKDAAIPKNMEAEIAALADDE